MAKSSDASKAFRDGDKIGAWDSLSNAADMLDGEVVIKRAGKANG